MNVLARICLVVLTLLPLPALAQAPGTLLVATPIAGAPESAQAWRIRYISTDDRGRPEEVTGVVVAPREARASKPRNVLAWAHGTWGVTSNCAPSSEEFFAATPGLGDAIRRGYVVVAPDYPGLGSDGAHGYLAGVSTARSVLDAVRAARMIPAASAGPSFAVWVSRKAAMLCALWTGQLARSYAPELRLVGVAAAAPPTDLVQNLSGEPIRRSAPS